MARNVWQRTAIKSLPESLIGGAAWTSNWSRRSWTSSSPTVPLTSLGEIGFTRASQVAQRQLTDDEELAKEAEFEPAAARAPHHPIERLVRPWSSCAAPRHPLQSVPFVAGSW